MGKNQCIYGNDGLFPVSNYYPFKDKHYAIFQYNMRMLNQTLNMFEYDNLPDTILPFSLEYYLQVNGHCAFIKHEGDYYVFTGGLGEYPNVYYLPTHYIVANPAFNISKSYLIDYGNEMLSYYRTQSKSYSDEDKCILIKNDSNLLGLIPMFNKYSSLLVENDITMRQYSINSRVPIIAAVHSDNQKSALEIFSKRVEDGDINMAVTDSFDESLRTMPYSAGMTTRITDLIEYHQYILSLWYRELGVNVGYNMKRENLSVAEVEQGELELFPTINDMLINRERAVDLINDRYGLNIKVRFNSTWYEFKKRFDLETKVIEAEAEGQSEKEETEEVVADDTEVSRDNEDKRLTE